VLERQTLVGGVPGHDKPLRAGKVALAGKNRSWTATDVEWGAARRNGKQLLNVGVGSGTPGATVGVEDQRCVEKKS